jgi:hypothetical protein
MVAFWRACAPVLADAVPHYAAPCCFTIDPASGLTTSHFQEAMPEVPAELIALEYAEDGVNRLPDVARSPSGISTLYEATGGNPSSSPRWHANMSLGADQEMIAALRTRSGDVWGAIGLYRQPDRPLFDADEKAFLTGISPLMADAVRRALLIGESADPEGPDAPGMIVLGRGWRPESMSPGVEEWLRDLPDGNWAASRLPAAVLAVAGRAARSATSTADPTEVAVAPGTDPLGPLGRFARRTARCGRQSAGCCHRRARASKSDRPAADVGLWPDSTGAAVDQTCVAGFLDDGHRRPSGDLGAHRAGTPEERLHQDRGARPA